MKGLIQFVIKGLFHGYRFYDIHIDDFIFVNTDHTVSDPFIEKANRLIAELCRQHSVRHGRRTAALNVPDTGGTNGIGRHLLQLFGKLFRTHDTFGHHDDVGMFSACTRTIDAHDDIVHIERNFRHDDNLRARSNPAVKRDIAAVSAHDLYDGNTLVRSHCIAELIDDIETSIHRGIEAERIIGILQIVVDCSGNPDSQNPKLVA